MSEGSLLSSLSAATTVPLTTTPAAGSNNKSFVRKVQQQQQQQQQQQNHVSASRQRGQPSTAESFDLPPRAPNATANTAEVSNRQQHLDRLHDLITTLASEVDTMRQQQEKKKVGSPLSLSVATTTTTTKPNSVPVRRTKSTSSSSMTAHGRSQSNSSSASTNSAQSSPLRSSSISNRSVKLGEALGEDWKRCYSSVKQAFFFFNTVTSQVMWESTRVTDRWERFFDHTTGTYFYLDVVTGVVSKDSPSDLMTLSGDDGNVGIDIMRTVTHEGSYYDEEGVLRVSTGGGRSALSRLGSQDYMTSTEEIYDEPDTPPFVDSDGNLLSEEERDKIRLKDHLEKRKKNMVNDGLRVLFEEQPPRPCYMIDPSSPPRVAWDFALILPILSLLALTLPFQMCFGYRPSNLIWYLVEFSIDIIFLLDIVLSFFTGYVNSNEIVIYDFQMVAVKYLKTWFILDLISAFPFGLLEASALEDLGFVKLFKSSRVLKTLRFLRFMKLTRLLKGSKLIRQLDQSTIDRFEDWMQDSRTRTVVRLTKLALQIAYTCHLMCCVWVLVSRSSGKYGSDYDDLDEPSTWLEAQGYDATSPTKAGDVEKIYLLSFYFCLTTMTSVGYGDIVPKNTNELVFVIILEGLGGFVYALVIASLTSVVTAMDSNQQLISERLDAVSSYVRNRRFPKMLGRRLRRYFRHYYSQKTAIDEQRILGELNANLRLEVANFLVSGVMGKVTIFKSMGPVHWPELLPLLRPCRFERGEMVCAQDEHSTEMFIVLDGVLEGWTDVVDFDDQELETLLRDDAVRNDEQNKVEASTSSLDGIELTSKSDDNLMLERSETQETHGSEPEISYFRKMRTINRGDTINILTLLRVWNRCVETVRVIESASMYAINSDTFFDTYKADSAMIDRMRHRTVRTMFEMTPDTDAPTGFGRPLFFLPEKEVREREERYKARLLSLQETYKAHHMKRSNSSPIKPKMKPKNKQRAPQGLSLESTDLLRSEEPPVEL